MINVGNHGLTCPTPEDCAAVALHMQNQGTIIDEVLTEDQALLTAYNNRLSAVAVSAVSSSFAALGGQVMPDGREANAPTFAGGTVLGSTSVTISGSSLILLVPPTTGWYDIGAYANVVPAGGVTLNSERVLYLQFLQTTSNPANPLNRLYQFRTTETNTGGEFLETSALVYMESGRNAFLQMFISHQNVASNLVTNAGAKIWVTFVAPPGGVVVNA